MKDIGLGIYGEKALAIMRLIAALEEGAYNDNMYVSFNANSLMKEAGMKGSVSFCSFVTIDEQPLDYMYVSSLLDGAILMSLADGHLRGLKHVFMNPNGEVVLKTVDDFHADYKFVIILASAKLGKIFKKPFTLKYVDCYQYHGALVGLHVALPGKKTLELTITPEDIVSFQNALSGQEYDGEYKHPIVNPIAVEANRIMIEEEQTSVLQNARRCEEAENECHAKVLRLKEDTKEALDKEFATL